jgi:hypothetical protein
MSQLAHRAIVEFSEIPLYNPNVDCIVDGPESSSMWSAAFLASAGHMMFRQNDIPQ